MPFLERPGHPYGIEVIGGEDFLIVSGHSLNSEAAGDRLGFRAIHVAQHLNADAWQLMKNWQMDDLCNCTNTE